MTKRVGPKLLHSAITARSRYFQVEELHLEFANGEQRVYERLAGSGRGAVMVVPVTDDGYLLLVKEYAAATERYELGFPKGLVDPGELPIDAANRELQEEIGFSAEQLVELSELSVAPGFMSAQMKVFAASGLTASRLKGDEPEPLELVRVPLDQAFSLLQRDDFNEARSVAALFLYEQWHREQS